MKIKYSPPLASPLDRMITSYYKGEFENNTQPYSLLLIHGDRCMVDSLKNYNDVFGGRSFPMQVIPNKSEYSREYSDYG